MIESFTERFPQAVQRDKTNKGAAGFAFFCKNSKSAENLEAQFMQMFGGKGSAKLPFNANNSPGLKRILRATQLFKALPLGGRALGPLAPFELMAPVLKIQLEQQRGPAVQSRHLEDSSHKLTSELGDRTKAFAAQ